MILFDIFELESLILIIISIIFTIIELLLYIKYLRSSKKLLFAAIGLYWAVVQSLSLIDYLTDWTFVYRTQWARTGVLFTLSILLGQSINKWQALHDGK